MIDWIEMELWFFSVSDICLDWAVGADEKVEVGNIRLRNTRSKRLRNKINRLLWNKKSFGLFTMIYWIQEVGSLIIHLNLFAYLRPQNL